MMTLAQIDDLATAYVAANPRLQGSTTRLALHTDTGAVVVSFLFSGKAMLGGPILVCHPTEPRFVEASGSVPLRTALSRLGLV